MQPPESIFFDGPEAFEAWLDEHAGTAAEVWIRMAKKHTGIPSLTWKDGVLVALCFGWIDGQARRIDDDFYVQRFTPRRPRSTWSKINRGHVEELVATGRMRPAGLAEVERAQADGRWDAAYDGMAAATVPDDLAAALEDAGQRAAFDALDSRSRYAILHDVQTAVRPQTRARRIARHVARISAG